MLKIINTSKDLFHAYENGVFSLEKWKEYIRLSFPSAEQVCLSDMENSLSTEYSWEKYYLPVLNAASRKKAEIAETSRIFTCITENLEERILSRFNKVPDVDIILYLGLCNGAGWVTEIEGKTTILLGIEKIIELGWNNQDNMNGLILHEVGHAYQAEFGVLHRNITVPADYYLWKLFIEGVAMVFEQETVGKTDYYHQDKNGWKTWCEENLHFIATSFEADRHIMTKESQRYFGDLVHFDGYPDTGYYLGTRFVRFMMNTSGFDEIIHFDVETVNTYFQKYLSE